MIRGPRGDHHGRSTVPTALWDPRTPDELSGQQGHVLARSALHFYRGTPQSMAHHLAATRTSGIVVQLNGDANLANFALYTARDGRLCFGLTDVRHSRPGPWEWDVLRLVVDLVVSGRTHGFNGAQRQRAVLRAVRRYRRATVGFAALTERELLMARPDEDEMRRLRDFGQAARLLATRSGRLSSADRQPHVPLVSAEVVRMASFTMAAYGELCAWSLALIHARTGDRRALAAHLSAEQDLEQRLVVTAEDYADQNERDHGRFAAAVTASSATPALSR